MTGTGERYSASKFKALLDKVLAWVVRSSLEGSERYNFGKLVNEGLGNSVSQVQGNIVGNIETVLVSAVVSMYLFVAVAAAYFESKLPVNSDISDNCQQCELDLDYIQFKCIVQVETLAVKRTRQQSGLNLDFGWNMPGDTNQSQVDILST